MLCLQPLTIKMEGYVLILLAKQESKTRTCQSLVSKQFEQRFTLPSGVKQEKISSKLSKEGILTVTAPREALSIADSRKNSNSIENKTKQINHLKQSVGLAEPKMRYEKDKIEISVDVKEYK